MMPRNETDSWTQKLDVMLRALNQSVHQINPCPKSGWKNEEGKQTFSYLFILFVMILFALTVGSLILGYTRSREVDKQSDPYHVYIKNRVTMI